jgi:Rieske Fe-S protein
MGDTLDTGLDTGRRSFLVRAIAAIYATIGTVMGVVLGRVIVAPERQSGSPSWLPAASLAVVRDHEPLAVTVRIVKKDGFTRVVDRIIIYLVKSGEHDVRALHSSCTHLGCRTSYNRAAKQIFCPCHGGVYDINGNVVAGPPPGPLQPLATRIENGRVMVQL